MHVHMYTRIGMRVSTSGGTKNSPLMFWKDSSTMQGIVHVLGPFLEMNDGDTMEAWYCGVQMQGLFLNLVCR